MRGARVQYQNPMISYCKTAPDQICRRAPNGSPCQAISRQKSAGRRQIWSGARLRAAEPPAGEVIPVFGTLSVFIFCELKSIKDNTIYVKQITLFYI